MLCAPRGGRGFFDANTYISVVAGRGRGGVRVHREQVSSKAIGHKEGQRG